VRQALNYAVNRSAIAKLLGNGYGVATDQMAVPGDDDYNPKLKNYYSYNPTKAKQLLAQAGYPNGFSMQVLSVAVAQQNTLEQVLQGELAQIGVTLQPTIETSVSDYATQLATTTYPAITLSWGRLPTSTQYQLLWGPDGQSSKPFGSTNTTMNNLYNKLITATPAQEPAVAQQMQKFLVQQAWYLPVCATPLADFYSPSITGVTATGQRDTAYIVEYAPAPKKK
jgi:peptide/nickel transport system substrate-binding protein